MKTRILILLLLAIGINSMAEEHLTFLGIPIDGPLDSFSRALEQKDLPSGERFIYHLSSMPSGTNPVFKGNFANRPAYVIAQATTETNIVYEVLVTFRELYTWNEMDSAYLALKTYLIAQYGVPAETNEVGVGPEDVIQVKQYLDDAILIRRCRFETETGTISLGIDNLRIHQHSRGVPYVYIIYSDKSNATLAMQEL